MATGIEFTGGDFTIGANGFSTANRYIRQVANPADGMAWMVEGPSIRLLFSPTPYWLFECGPYAIGSLHPDFYGGFAIDRLIAL